MAKFQQARSGPLAELCSKPVVGKPGSGPLAELCAKLLIGKPRLRRWEASQYLRERHGIELAVATLAKLACLGGGPPFQKAGRVPLYPVDLLDEWAVARLGRVVHSTSENGHGAF